MSEPLDLARARAETRACESLIHFNNAGASLMPAPVSDALHEWLRDEEQYGGYETAARRNDDLEHFYAATARLINAKAHEVAYVENATRAFDLAFYGFRFQPGDRILTAVAEYGSNVIAYLQQARHLGVEVVFVPDDEHGQVDVDALAELVDDRVKLISMTHIPTGGGLVNPAARIGEVARSAGVPFLLDACQSVGQIDVDVQAIGCDVLSATGRKYLRGPRGTGFLYVSEPLLERLEPPFLDQHAADLVSPTEYVMRDDARRFENWEQYFGGKHGLAVAVDYALGFGMEAIETRVCALAERLRDGLAGIEGVHVTDQGARRCGIVTFHADGLDAETLAARLLEQRINVSVSSGSGNLVSFEARGLTAVVRASVHYFNTDEEIARFLDTLSACLRA